MWKIHIPGYYTIWILADSNGCVKGSSIWLFPPYGVSVKRPWIMNAQSHQPPLQVLAHAIKPGPAWCCAWSVFIKILTTCSGWTTPELEQVAPARACAVLDSASNICKGSFLSMTPRILSITKTLSRFTIYIIIAAIDLIWLDAVFTYLTHFDEVNWYFLNIGNHSRSELTFCHTSW